MEEDKITVPYAGELPTYSSNFMKQTTSMRYQFWEVTLTLRHDFVLEKRTYINEEQPWEILEYLRH
jgi:hypothetical protein